MAVTLVQSSPLALSLAGTAVAVLPGRSTAGTTLLGVCASSAGATPFETPDGGWTWVTSVSVDTHLRAAVFIWRTNPGGVTAAGFTSAGTVAAAVTEWSSSTGGTPDVDQLGRAISTLTGSSGDPGLVGDNCNATVYGAGNQATAITNWEATTGRTLSVRRAYFTTPPGLATTALLADASAGRSVALSFRPAAPVMSPSDRSALDATLAACQAAGLTAQVALWAAPKASGLTPSQYHRMVDYYGPTVRKYYPLVFCADASTAATQADYAAYYTSGAFDAAAVNHYCADHLAGVDVANYAAVTDPDLLPFGVWEFGVNESTATTLQGQAFYDYLTAFSSARLTAGKALGYFCHNTANPPDTRSTPAFTALDYQIAKYQALWDGVTIVVPGLPPTSLTVTEDAASLAGDAAVALFGTGFAAAAAGNTWTDPVGWTASGKAGNDAGPLAAAAYYQAGLSAGTLAVTGTYSTNVGIQGWGGILVTLTDTALDLPAPASAASASSATGGFAPPVVTDGYTDGYKNVYGGTPLPPVPGPPGPPPPPPGSTQQPPPASLLAPPAPSRWQFLYGPCQPNWSPAGEIVQAQTRSLTLRSGAGNSHEATVDVDGRSSIAALVAELSTDMQVMWGGQALFAGRVVPSQDTLDGDSHRTQFTAQDYREVLRRRAMQGPTSWSNFDPAFICWELLVFTQLLHGGDLGISQGRGQSTGTVIDYAVSGGDIIGDQIDQLAQTLAGFDWDITPYSPTDLRLDIWFPRRGTDRGVVLSPGDGTVSSPVTREVDPSTYGNAVYVTGDSAHTLVDQQLEAWNIRTVPGGRWDQVVGTTAKTQSSLNNRAGWVLQDSQVLVPTWTVPLRPGAWSGPDHIWIGDKVRLRVKSGRLKVNELLNVVEMDFAVSADGVEQLTLTLGRYPFRMHEKIPRALRRISALETR